MSAEVVVRDLEGAVEMSACESLYAGVMGLRPADGSINPRLLTALQANSGIVLGALTGRTLIGFAYSFLAHERAVSSGPDAGGGRLYQYSQLVVVAPEHQGTGVGRMLKYAQRARCLTEGITLMRWAFDPLKTVNAHFNLDVLGARLVRLVPSMYGSHGFGTDTGEDTDRFIVDWNLTDPPEVSPPLDAPGELAAAPGRVVVDGSDLLISIPAHWQRYRAEHGADEAAALRHELRRSFGQALDSGRIGVSCQQVSKELYAYRFAAREGAQRPALQLVTSRP
jgi:predicted GNAT superfamily acetyltransferase